jgi:hypothetical protein
LHIKSADQFFPLHNFVSRVVLKSRLICLLTSVCLTKIESRTQSGRGAGLGEGKEEKDV